MITTGKILKFDKHGNKLLLELPENVERELIQKHIGSVELRLNDGRSSTLPTKEERYSLLFVTSHYGADTSLNLSGHT